MIAMLFGAIIPALFGLFMYLLFDEVSLLIRVWKSYPYFGNVVRLSGLTMTPGYLSSVLSIGMIYLINSKKWNYLVIIVTLFVLIMTLSKNLVPLIGVFGIYFLVKTRMDNLFTGSIVLLLTILAFSLPTMFVVKSQEGISFEEKHLLNDEDSFQYRGYTIYPTSYYELKMTATTVIKRRFPRGLGPAQFLPGLDQLKNEGLFAKDIEPHVPHDTYIGTIAEYGIFGLIAILILTIGVMRNIIGIHPDLVGTPVYTFLILSVLYIMIQSIMVDTQHLRHYWLILIFLNTLPLIRVELLQKV